MKPKISADAEPWTVFLDRDGVINRKPPTGEYVKSWSAFRWLPGAPEALTRLHAAGARIVIVTNQQGVAKGVVRAEDLDEVHRRLRAEVGRGGTRIAGIYVCPHLEGACDCRKPALGLFHSAQRDFPDLSFARSVVVGDSSSDMEAGRHLGARTVFIDRDGTGSAPGVDAVASDLPEATDRWILPWLRA